MEKGFVIICKDANNLSTVLGYFAGYAQNDLNLVGSIYKAQIFTDPYQLHVEYERLIKYHTKNTYISKDPLHWASALVTIETEELV